MTFSCSRQVFCKTSFSMGKRYLTVLCLMLLAAGVRAQTGTWSGKLEIQGTSLAVVVHFNEDGCTMDSPDQGVRGIRAEVSRTPLGGVVLSVPSIGAAYEAFLIGEKLVGTFTQHGVSFPLTLTPGEFRRSRPQTPQPPFPYATQEVSFRNGDALLRGTLTLPEGYDVHTPVLVLVTGSGLQNRDEELFEHKPFAVIADALARRGIATLRYDDRGFGESTGGDLVCVTTEDLKDDALAGVEFLRGRFDRVGVLGHSEGGTIALMLAAEKRIDFAVSLAGMVVSGKETLLLQNRLLLPYSGFSQKDTEVYCKALSDAFDCIVEGLKPADPAGIDLPDALKQNLLASVAQSSTPYMKYFLRLDVSQRLNGIECPVLALNGTKDVQVDCARNLDALRAGLPASAEHQVLSFEGLNHLFQHCRTGMPDEYKEIEETVAPEVLTAISDWILKR